MEQQFITPTERLVVESAIKSHALKVSQTLGKNFERVGSDFVEAVQADVERLIKVIIGQYQPPIHDVVKAEEGQRFITGAYLKKAEDIINAAVPRIIQARVQRHPSIGKTLKA